MGLTIGGHACTEAGDLSDIQASSADRLRMERGSSGA